MKNSIILELKKVINARDESIREKLTRLRDALNDIECGENPNEKIIELSRAIIDDTLNLLTKE